MALVSLARPEPFSLFPTCCVSRHDSSALFPSVPNSLSSVVPESTKLKRADPKPASAWWAIVLNPPPSVAASWGQGSDASSREASGKRKPLGTAEAASGESGAPGEAGELNREALVPSSLLLLDWLHTLRSGLRQPKLQLGKSGGRRRPRGVLYFCGGRGRSLWVAVKLFWSREMRLGGRRRRGLTGLPGKSGSSGSSEVADDWSLPLKLLLLKARFGSGGWNHGTACRLGCRCDLRTPLAAYVLKKRVPGAGRDAAMAGARPKVQTETPRDSASAPAGPPGPSAGSQPRSSPDFPKPPGGRCLARPRALGAAQAGISFQADTECTQSRVSACGSDPVQHVEEWHSVICAVTSNKENVTVAAEISLGHTKQLLKDVTELQILGEITFNKSLYEGLNAENHRTKITVILLKAEELHSLPLIIGSSVGGLLLLVVIIAILFKCGFFKRKYQQLNLESIRRAQLKADSLLEEE